MLVHRIYALAWGQGCTLKSSRIEWGERIVMRTSFNSRSCLRPLMAALACFLLLCGRGFAQPVRTQHLTVELVTESNTIAPNRDFLAGLHFMLDPGWHVYW